MRRNPTWFPNADGKCSGSFQIATHYPDADGKVVCEVCGRKVGLRNPRARQIAQHIPPKPVPARNYIAQSIEAGKRMMLLQQRVIALGGDVMPGHGDSFTFPGSEREQQAKFALASGTSGLLFGEAQPGRLFNMKIQDILGALLSAYGKHHSARLAFESTKPEEWQALGDQAIAAAPEHNKTHTAQVVRLALDDKANGGLGVAADYEIRKESNPVTGAPWFRAYRRVLGGLTDIGLASPEKEKLERRVVALHVVREFYYTEKL